MKGKFIIFAFLLLSFISLKTFSQYTYHCGGSLLHFHGTNAYVDAEDPLYYNQGITLAAWVRCEVKNPSNMGLIFREFFADQGASTLLEWGLIINSKGEFMFKGSIDTSGGRTFEPSTQPQLDSLSSGIVPDSGKFYHVAVTLDQNTHQCNFYINGNIVASKTMKGGLHWAVDIGGNFEDASIGCESLTYQGGFNTFAYFNGYIDDVLMSGAALSKSQIDTIANGNDLGGTNSYMNYHFNEGSGSTTVSNPGLTYNSSGYGNTGYLNGDIAWVTNDACPPFPLSFIDPYPAMVKNDGTLNTNVADIDMNKTLVGAATDGLAKVLLVAKTDKEIQFQISSLAQGSLSSLDQTITNQTAVQAKSNNGYAVAVYTAPDGYGSNNPKGGRNISVYGFRIDSPTIYSVKNLQLVTPPVVLVHGMWSDPSVWENGGFRNQLLNNGFPVVFPANYKPFNSWTFNPSSPASLPGRTAVEVSVKGALNNLRNLKIAVAQVDIVGHSLGGLMSRSFSQQPNFKDASNYNKGYFHKLITLGTPHRGSPFGPELWKNRNNIVRLPYTVTFIPLWQLMELAGQPIGSCHFDFANQSNGINALSQTLPYKTFSVTCDYTGQNSGYSALDYLCHFAFRKSLNEVMAERAPCLGPPLTNDLIVPLSSQKGFVSGGKDTLFLNTTHSGIPLLNLNTETNSQLIQNKVVDLLLTNDVSEFGEGFPSPSTLPLDCNSANEKYVSANNGKIYSQTSTGDQSIKIISPVAGTKYQQGSITNITLTFTTSGGALPTYSMFVVKNIGWFSVPTFPPYSVTFALPSNSPIGKIEILALSLDSTGLRLADSSYVTILPNGALNIITADPQIVELDSSFREKPVYVHGYFKTDSITVENDLSDGLTGTSYSSLKGGTIFKVSKDGLVIAVNVGTDTLLVTSMGQTLKIPVIVDSNFLNASFSTNSIDFQAIPDKIISDDPFGLDASSLSGEQVYFTLVSGPVKLENGIVVITGTGTVTIEATSPGDAYFADATPVFRTFQITDALPLTLLNFTGSLNSNNKVNLNWQTAQEINTSNFIIERSSDGNSFSSLDKVNASGNSSSIKNYAYLDQNPLKGINFYRLKMVDIDGKFTYSNIINVKVNDLTSSFKIFPNPANEVLNVQLSGINDIATLLIVDAIGRKLKEEKINLTNNTSFSINIKNLPKGIYNLFLKGKSTNVHQKFVKQ